MEKATSRKNTKAKKIEAPQIKEQYLDYLLMHGKAPASAYSFAKELGISEEEFYAHYTSFEMIEREIWKDMMEDTMQRVVNDEAYGPYSAREKMLALYFTLIEVLKAKRSYVSLRWPKRMMPGQTPEFLKDFKDIFFNWTNDILNEGKENNEVVIRPYVSERYDQATWLQAIFLMDFWIKDNSKGFEATDAAIEKSVNLGFDLVGPGPLDSIIDFGRFLISQRK